jgi:hypothetical protein
MTKEKTKTPAKLVRTYRTKSLWNKLSLVITVDE